MLLTTGPSTAGGSAIPTRSAAALAEPVVPSVPPGALARLCRRLRRQLHADSAFVVALRPGAPEPQLLAACDRSCDWQAAAGLLTGPAGVRALPLDGAALMLFDLGVVGGWRIGVGAVRHGASFDPHAQRAARRIEEWVHDVVALAVEVEARAAAEAAARGVIDALDLCVIVVDAQAEVLATNPCGGALVAGGALAVRGGRLGTMRLDESIRLQAAIAHAGDRTGDEATTLLAVERAGSAPLTLAVVPLPAGAGAAVAAVIGVDPDGDRAHACDGIARLHGFSGAETRLAALLVAGLSPAEAAVRLRIQPETARSYLKAMFVKTGTRRQSELVRRLIGGAVPLRTKPAVPGA